MFCFTERGLIFINLPYDKQEKIFYLKKKSEKFRAGPGFSTRPGNPGSGPVSGFENFPGRVPGFEIFFPGSGPGSGFHFKIFRVPGPGTRPALNPDIA